MWMNLRREQKSEMDSVDITQIIGLIGKSGPAAMTLAIFMGLAALVREVRGGKASADELARLTARVAVLEAAQNRNEVKLATLLDATHEYRRQRDQARTRTEFLEMLHNIEPRTQWPPDPHLTEVDTPANVT